MVEITGFGPIIAMIAGFTMFMALISITLYIYSALAFMGMAKKTNTEHGWFAFIPILNFYLMTQIAEVPWWTLLLVLFIPFVNIIVIVWWFWKIAQNVNRPGWWAILLLIPLVNLIILGIMAWGGKEQTRAPEEGQEESREDKTIKAGKKETKGKFKDPWK